MNSKRMVRLSKGVWTSANQVGNFSRDKYTHVTFCAPTSVKLNPESADYIRSKYYGASSLSSLSCCCPLRSLRYIIPRRFVFTLSWGMRRQRVSDGHDPCSEFFERNNFSNWKIFHLENFQILNSILFLVRRRREKKKEKKAELIRVDSFVFSRLDRFSFELRKEGIVNLCIEFIDRFENFSIISVA